MSTRMLLAIAMAALISAGASCSDDPVGSSTDDPREARAVLDAARDRWERRGPSSYDYTIDQACFCAFVGRARVEVRDGVVTRVTRLEDGEDVASGGFGPVEGLFDQIVSRLDLGADRVELSFDPELGYPTSALVDVFQIADEELNFRVETLEAR